MNMWNREAVEAELAQLPLLQYAFAKPEELVFTERVRHVCEAECPMYGKTWACPPAVGTVEACREKCLGYEGVLILSTVTEVSDISNLEETLATRGGHEAVTHQAEAILQAQGLETMGLSTEACAICPQCAYPDGPCRHPEKMYPCVESHGILVTEVAERLGLEFFNGNLVTWFSLVFFRS